MKSIVLNQTGLFGAKPIRVMPAVIVSLDGDKDGTTVTVIGGGTCQVKETPDEIEKLIADSETKPPAPVPPFQPPKP